MKFLILLAIIAVTQAERDWSKIKLHNITRNVRWNFVPQGPRIVGGYEVKPHSLPFQAALNINNPGSSSLCGGSLISNKYVLTAAHCVNKAESVEVILGAHNINKEEPTQVTVSVPQSNIQVHEEYDPKNNLNDLALLEFPEEIKFTDSIQALPPPDKSFVGNTFEGETATVSGWGRYSDSSSGTSDVLLAAGTPIVSNEFCNSVYGIIGEGHICADGFQHKGSCNGDSGGPLTVTVDGKKIQVGVVSFGSSFGCSFGFPSVYTRVTAYLDWIKNHSNV